jgi:hypothetical protein
MMPGRENTVVMEDVQIAFRNFSGRAGMYNKEGDRSFAVKLSPEWAEELTKRGWNVKYLKARDEDENDQPFISVAVKFDGPRPPKVFMITKRGRTQLSENEVEILDYVDILQVDLVLNPYEWSVNGNSGIKAYLDSIYVIILENELEAKYGNMDIATVDGPAMQPGTGPNPEPPRVPA